MKPGLPELSPNDHELILVHTDKMIKSTSTLTHGDHHRSSLPLE
jgi:hypothetical protein